MAQLAERAVEVLRGGMDFLEYRRLDSIMLTAPEVCQGLRAGARAQAGAEG